MKKNRINLRLLCALISILLVSNGLQAMEKAMTEEVRKNVEKLLKPRSCKNCNFQEADLRRANLGLRANLKGANLKGADLTGANLPLANLSGANLEEADLRGANLKGVNLKGANLKRANLTWKADLRNTNLKGANLTAANLTGANLNNANLTEANLTGANLRETDLTWANLKGVIGMTDQEVINSGAKLNNKTTLPSGKKYSK